jgi:hypothetical protein
VVGNRAAMGPEWESVHNVIKFFCISGAAHRKVFQSSLGVDPDEIGSKRVSTKEIFPSFPRNLFPALDVL